MRKRLMVALTIILVMSFFVSGGVRQAQAQASHATSTCWQDNCDTQDYAPYCYSQVTDRTVTVIDGYGHTQGQLQLESSGASGGGCMAKFAQFYEYANESLKQATVEIVRFGDTDGDNGASSAWFTGLTGGNIGWLYWSPLRGFEGNYEDCFYAYIQIESNNSTWQHYQTTSICPS